MIPTSAKFTKNTSCVHNKEFSRAKPFGFAGKKSSNTMFLLRSKAAVFVGFLIGSTRSMKKPRTHLTLPVRKNWQTCSLDGFSASTDHAITEARKCMRMKARRMKANRESPLPVKANRESPLPVAKWDYNLKAITDACRDKARTRAAAAGRASPPAVPASARERSPLRDVAPVVVEESQPVRYTVRCDPRSTENSKRGETIFWHTHEGSDHDGKWVFPSLKALGDPIELSDGEGRLQHGHELICVPPLACRPGRQAEYDTKDDLFTAPWNKSLSRTKIHRVKLCSGNFAGLVVFVPAIQLERFIKDETLVPVQ